jgi:transcriptional regulator with XRE-family HTH domain
MSRDIRKLVGQNVRRLRIAAKVTQAELSVRMGVDRAYVSGLERGQRNATILSLWYLSQALNVKIGALFEEQKRKP